MQEVAARMPLVSDKLPAQALIVARAPITETGYCDLHQPASPLLTRAVVLAQPVHFLTEAHEPHPFFEITAFSMSLSRLKSTTSFFNRGFHPPTAATVRITRTRFASSL